MPANSIPLFDATGTITSDSDAAKRNVAVGLNLTDKNILHFAESYIPEDLSPSEGSASVVNDEGDCTPMFVAADSAANGAGLDIPKLTYRLKSNCTISNHVRFAPGARFKLESGVTLILENGYTADDYAQVFDFTLGGTVLCSKGYVTPQHCGAPVDGSNSDSTAIGLALTIAGTNGKVKFPKSSSYVITSAIAPASQQTVELDNVEISADGNFRPISVVGTELARVSDIAFKGRAKVTCINGAANNSGISFQYADNCSVEGVHIIDSFLNGAEMLNCVSCRIEDCYLENCGKFGILIYNCVACRDVDLTIDGSDSFSHEIKATEFHVSQDLYIPVGSATNVSCYLWTGFDTVGGTPPPRITQGCRYVNPVIYTIDGGSAAIRVQGSPYNEIINPKVFHGNNSVCIEVAGRGEGTTGMGSILPEGTVITNPQIEVGEDCSACISIAGDTTSNLKSCTIIGGRPKGGRRGILLSYIDECEIGQNIRIEDQYKVGAVSHYGIELSNGAVLRINGAVITGQSNIGIYIPADCTVWGNMVRVKDSLGQGINSIGVGKFSNSLIKDCFSHALITSGAGSIEFTDGEVDGCYYDPDANFEGMVRFTNTSNYSIIRNVKFKNYGPKCDCWIRSSMQTDVIENITFDNDVNNPIISSATLGYRNQEVITYGATTKFQFNKAPVNKRVVLTGNITTATFKCVSVGFYSIVIQQDGTGGYTFALPAGIVGTAPSLDTAADAETVFLLFFDGTLWHHVTL